MGSLSNYAEDAWINHLVGTAYTQPATVYLALATADPTDAATGASCNECANANNYARVACTFGAASASWGTVVATAIVDGAGALLVYDNGTADQAVASGDTVSFPANDIDISLS